MDYNLLLFLLSKQGNILFMGVSFLAGINVGIIETFNVTLSIGNFTNCIMINYYLNNFNLSNVGFMALVVFKIKMKLKYDKL